MKIPMTKLTAQFHSAIINYIKNYKSLKKCKLYINGDMNIDLLKIDSHSQSNECLTTHYDHGLLSYITKPTRIHNHTATIIDHMYENQLILGWYHNY